MAPLDIIVSSGATLQPNIIVDWGDTMYTNSTVVEHKHVGTVIPLDSGEMKSCEHSGMILEMDCRQLPHGDHIVHYEENHPDKSYEIRLCAICDGSVER